jgi:hypothetical protein
LRVLAAARHPGAAEAVGPVAAELRRDGHTVRLIGVRNDTPDTKVHGGSASVFERSGLRSKDLREAGYGGDVVDLPAEFADALIDSFRPEAIFVGCSLDETGEHMGIEEALVQAGDRHSIKTVQMIEYWDVWRPRTEPSFASTYTALDDLTRKVLEARGVPAGSILVTGHPGLDMFAETPETRKSDRCPQPGIAGERSLGYFGQAADSEGNPDNPTTLGWTLDALPPRDRLVFSKHPRDDRSYSEALRDSGRGITARCSGDELLGDVDICVTHYSLMGLKAALLNIPTVNILPDGECTDIRALCGGFPLSLLGGSQEAHTPDELRELLAGPLEGNASGLKRALNVDGESTHRVVQQVIEG